MTIKMIIIIMRRIMIKIILIIIIIIIIIIILIVVIIIIIIIIIIEVIQIWRYSVFLKQTNTINQCSAKSTSAFFILSYFILPN